MIHEIIEGIIKKEQEVLNEQVNNMISRYDESTELMSKEEKEMFLMEHNLELVGESEYPTTRVMLLHNGDIIDGFEMFVDYDDMDIKVNIY